MWDVSASMWAAKELRGLLQPLSRMLQALWGLTQASGDLRRYCVGCHNICADYCSLYMSFTGAMGDAINSKRFTTASMWDAQALRRMLHYLWGAVTDAILAVQLLCGTLNPLCGMLRPMYRLLHPLRGSLQPLCGLQQHLNLALTGKEKV